jgi:hypothetical protein
LLPNPNRFHHHLYEEMRWLWTHKILRYGARTFFGTLAVIDSTILIVTLAPGAGAAVITTAFAHVVTSGYVSENIFDDV